MVVGSVVLGFFVVFLVVVVVVVGCCFGVFLINMF